MIAGQETEEADTLLKQVRRTIEIHHMLQQGDGVVIGVSGGADSMCLLAMLQELKQEYSLRLQVVHVNHKLRVAAEEEAAYVEDICRQWGILCTVCEKDIHAYANEMGMSVEEAGRTYRYACFEQIRSEAGYQKIAVAHHADDRAETLLFHMSRGTGLRGLGSIPPVRGRIIRPLLSVSREEIEAYLRMQKIRYYIDESNLESEYSRNYIRNQIMPEVRKLNERAVEHMSEVSELAQEYWEYVEAQAQELEINCVTQTEHGLELQERLFMQAPELVRRHLVYRALSQAAGSAKNLEQQHIQQVLELFEKAEGKQVMLPYHLQAVRIRGGVRVCDKTVKAEQMEAIRIPIKIDGRTMAAGRGVLECRLEEWNSNLEITKNLYTKMFDYDKIYGTLCLRTPQLGDYLVIDTQGRRKKLSRFFIDNKVPGDQRSRMLVVADGSRICWVLGMRISEDIKVTETTSRVLVLSYQCKGEENG